MREVLIIHGVRSLYQELRPSSHLCDTVASFWALNVLETGVHRVLPDGCCDFIAHWAADSTTVSLSIVGAMTRPHSVLLRQGEFLWGIRFIPGRFGWLFQQSLDRITDQQIAVPPGRVISSLSVGQARDASLHELKALSETILGDPPPASRAQSAMRMLLDTVEQPHLDKIEALTGLSERQFRRSCLRETGLPPKKLLRIGRFRHALQRLERNKGDLVRMAVDLGFYDQAHMNREFRVFAGASPTQAFMNADAASVFSNSRL